MAGESNISSSVFDVTAQKYVEAVNAKDYRKAAKMLHFPGNMEEKAKQKEVRVISESLGILVDELGAFDRYQPGEADRFYSVFIMAGSLDYWSDKMDGVSVIYRVQYNRKGQGYLIFRYAKLHSKLVLRAVEYGLPRAQSGALETIKHLIYRIATEPDRSDAVE